jgi:5-methylcytosine-specific restriction endonuclease McrA
VRKGDSEPKKSHIDNAKERKNRQTELHLWFREWAMKRDRNVCKPCWEIHYCPYGPLVEQFPLPYKTIEEAEQDNISKSLRDKQCTVFRHICPVYFVSEPFTETVQVRTVSRHISRQVLIRVVRRDDSTCQVCGKHLLDNEIQLDHIIPVTKGGPSSESNLRVICCDCNIRKSNKVNLA